MIVPIQASAADEAMLAAAAPMPAESKASASGFLALLFAHVESIVEATNEQRVTAESVPDDVLSALLVRLGEMLSDQRRSSLYDGMPKLTESMLDEAAAALDGHVDADKAQALAAHLWSELVALVHQGQSEIALAEQGQLATLSEGESPGIDTSSRAGRGQGSVEQPAGDATKVRPMGRNGVTIKPDALQNASTNQAQEQATLSEGESPEIEASSRAGRGQGSVEQPAGEASKVRLMGRNGVTIKPEASQAGSADQAQGGALKIGALIRASRAPSAVQQNLEMDLAAKLIGRSKASEYIAPRHWAAQNAQLDRLHLRPASNEPDATLMRSVLKEGVDRTNSGMGVRQAVSLLQEAYSERSVPTRFEAVGQSSGARTGQAFELFVGNSAPSGADVPIDSASGATTTTALPRVWATPEILGEVTVQNVRYLVVRGEETVTVRLVPPSLGEMRIEVTRLDDSLSLRLASASPVVRTLLEGRLPELRQLLAQDGFDLTRTTVSADLSGSHHGTETPERSPTPFGQPIRSGPQNERGEADDLSGSKMEPRIRERRHDGALSIYA